MTARRSGPRGPSGSGDFFDRFRTALGRLPAGLIRPGPPGSADDAARAEAALGRSLPDEYASFLRSFDGVDLFHESLLVAGVGPGAALLLAALPQDYAGELVFAQAQAGDLFALDRSGRVLRRDPGSDERALAGSSFDRWLDATIAREQVLFGSDGEYLPDLYDDAGTELLPHIALRQAERALRADPGAADTEHGRGSALVRLGRLDAALAAFRRAADLDPDNPWPAFDLGRTAMALARPAEALAAFRRAGELEAGPNGARLLAWAARAASAVGDREGAAALRGLALERDPGLVDHLRQAARAAAEEEDPEATAEAVALLEIVEPGGAGLVAVRRLPVVRRSTEPAKPDLPAHPKGRRRKEPVSGPTSPPRRRARRHRPRHGAPPRSDGPKPGRPR